MFLCTLATKWAKISSIYSKISYFDRIWFRLKPYPMFREFSQKSDLLTRIEGRYSRPHQMETLMLCIITGTQISGNNLQIKSSIIIKGKIWFWGIMNESEGGAMMCLCRTIFSSNAVFANSEWHPIDDWGRKKKGKGRRRRRSRGRGRKRRGSRGILKLSIQCKFSCWDILEGAIISLECVLSSKTWATCHCIVMAILCHFSQVLKWWICIHS